MIELSLARVNSNSNHQFVQDSKVSSKTFDLYFELLNNYLKKKTSYHIKLISYINSFHSF